MTNGIGMMLKSLGLDPTEIMKKVEEFQTGIKTVLTNISVRLENIEKQQADIREAQKVNYNLLTELTAWKRQQKPQLQLVQSPPMSPQPPQPMPQENQV